MKSPELGMVPNPTRKKVDEALEGIEKASELDSRLEAERLGISVEEFNKRPTEIPTGYKGIQYTNHFQEEFPVLNAKDFLEKWEKEHATESKEQKEQLPQNITITDETSYHISHFFISSILKKAIKAVRANYYYEKENPVIDSLDEISAITISNTEGGKKLHFEVYLNKRNFLFMKERHLVMFNVDLEGNVILS
jgi:hypothetical protein